VLRTIIYLWTLCGAEEALCNRNYHDLIGNNSIFRCFLKDLKVIDSLANGKCLMGEPYKYTWISSI